MVSQRDRVTALAADLTGLQWAMHIDLLDPDTFASGHPHAVYAWLRDNDPVYWHDEPNGPGFWAVTRYADVDAAGRNPGLFSSEPTIMIADPEAGMDLSFGDKKMMLTMDPPRHTEFRKIISREFTKGPALALAPRIDELANQIIDAVAARGECEFVSEIAGELPSYVIAELMGIPLQDGRELYALTEIIHTAAEALPEGAQAKAVMEMFAYAQGVYRTKLDTPADDLASQIVHAEVDGERLDEIDFQLFFMLLVDAGGDTTRNLVAGGLHALIERPELLAAAPRDAAGLSRLRDELLRYVSPVIYMRRTATADTELGGKRIRAGDKVVRYFGAANFDDRKFHEPQRLDPQRDARPHIAFGSGTHVCLGQHIARVEIDGMFNALFRRLRDFRLLEAPAYLQSNFISGIKRMPVGFRVR